MLVVALTVALVPALIGIASNSGQSPQADAVWRVDPEVGVRFEAGDPAPVLRAELSGAVAVEDGVHGFADPGGKVTFAGDARFGVTSGQSFTLTLELRTSRGAFATPLICREGSYVHYSMVIGRHAGTIAFEPWCWARARAESRTRIDDGDWHRLEGCYDASSRRVALLVDGQLEADVAVPEGFDGSPAPALRLGDNLDPNVRQAFFGELRAVSLVLGIPDSLNEQRVALAATRVFDEVEVAAMLEAWNDRARERRAPTALDAGDWKRTAERTRALVQDACGLWPPPYSGESRADHPVPHATSFAGFTPSLPLDVRTGGALERDGWSVQRVYWQTFAGFHASGWLYRPIGGAGPRSRAAVLCPHGHWGGGATHPVVQKRCITLARAGYVVLAVDSIHLEDPRIALSPLSVMTWNNLRGLELLRAQPDVDPERIGCTGASGGGQQTYYLTGLDSGIAAAVPAVMACHFHEILGTDGPHCHCNHTPHLAAWTDMPIMAAAFAPRPQLFLTVTGDWTREFPEQGFPEVASVYEVFGAREVVDVMQWPIGHDYNRPMRNAMYAFFARHLQGAERPDPELEREEAPAVDPRALLALNRDDVPHDTALIVAEFQSRLARRAPAAIAVTADRLVDTLRSRLLDLFGREAPPSDRSATKTVAVAAGPEGFERWSTRSDQDVRVPMLVGRSGGAPRAVVVFVHPDGKAKTLRVHRELVATLRAGGVTVVAVDLRYTGELDAGRNWRDLHGRFYGLDEGQLAVRDLRAVIAAMATVEPGVPVFVVADGWMGAVALLAGAIEDRIRAIAAPELGPSWTSGPRRPHLSRVLLHTDLPDAAVASFADHLLLGGSPPESDWSFVTSRLADRIKRRAAPLDDGDLGSFITGLIERR